MIIGVGSGSTVVYAVDRIVERVKSEGLKLQCVPSSFQAEQLIADGKLALLQLSNTAQIDVCIDGADEVDADLNLIKGGGGCHVQEKVVASCAKQLVIIADYRKQASRLGTAWTKGVPVEVVPCALASVTAKLTRMGAKVTLRMGAPAKAGPAVSDNGNLLMDAVFGPIADPAALHAQILQLPGVVDTGLFVRMACKAFFGQADGTVTSIQSASNKPSTV